MNVDLDNAQETAMRPILDLAADIGLTADDLELYGNYKAKIALPALRSILNSDKRRGKLVFVTAITPTRSGEGKTTVSIGLAQALSKTGVRTIAALRQPSLGPLFGQKGGAAGGGKAQAVPTEDINLHFTGDMHAIASANNLLAAMLDNHLFRGNALQIDRRTVAFKRALDMNDRNLRYVVTGLGGKSNGCPMETGFDITAASEVMAILCLSESIADLKHRLSAIVLGHDINGKPVTAGELGASNAMAVLLKDAIKPNLVQTMEGTPMFVHGGPFANIAHGCSSVLATRLALKLADFVVTEGGFGSDLGFEKYCDIVAATRAPELVPDTVVLVVTIRALKLHGGMQFSKLANENVEAVRKGLPNLERHVRIIESYGLLCVVAINQFSQDTEDEIAAVLSYCKKHSWRVALSDVYSRGGEGGLELAQLVRDTCSISSRFTPAYSAGDSIMQKLESLAQRVYGADGIILSGEATKQMSWLSRHGFESVPVCVAKTQYSLSDDPKLLGAPSAFRMRVRSLHLSAGAGFVVALMGDIMTMPGLPKSPSALLMDLDNDGNVIKSG